MRPVILNYLSTQENWTTSFSMSALLNISVRSIKSYIRDINLQHPGLVDSSREGFLIRDKERLAGILSQQKASDVPQTSEDRMKYILKKLLLQAQQYHLDKLAAELCISPATLLNEFPKIKSELFDFDLTLKTKNNLASVDGQEGNKKKLISKLIYEDSKDSFLSIKFMQKYLPHYDLGAIKEIVVEALRAHLYFMDDFSLLNLVMHIAITMERKKIQDITATNQAADWETITDQNIRAIIDEVADKVTERFQVELAQSEIYYFALLLMTRAISNSINDADKNELTPLVGEEVVRLVSLMQEKTKETYNISITNQDFTFRFSLHIKNLLTRLRHGIVLRNPQMSEIKNSYPFIYDVSVFIANILTQETGYILAEDEISYFTLYLGVLIEERKVIKHEVRAVLICPQYFFNSVEIAAKLSVSFDASLMVTGIISSFDELDTYPDYDLIISTIPIPYAPAAQSIQISNYLNNKDILAISKKIEVILKDRIKSKVESKLRLMFKENLFFIDDKLKNQNDVIEKLADTLEANGYVDSAFKSKLFEREILSSSAYLNIAMPHPFEMCALNSAIAVSIHPAAIPWNSGRVNIVFLLAINIRDSLFFKDIFDFITEVVVEDKKLKNILEAKSFDQFIATLVACSK